MNEYIDRDALRQAVLESQHDNPHPRGMAHIAHDCEHAHFVAMIARFPAADVAPVVRCKDCVHWDDDPDTYGADYGPKGKCMKSFETMCADDFCSYGERKDGES